jgi:hypothetical protein
MKSMPLKLKTLVATMFGSGKRELSKESQWHCRRAP